MGASNFVPTPTLGYFDAILSAYYSFFHYVWGQSGQMLKNKVYVLSFYIYPVLFSVKLFTFPKLPAQTEQGFCICSDVHWKKTSLTGPAGHKKFRRKK
jgi:hypothetical protein